MVQRVRVLVVDDERELADVVAGYLRREAFEVFLAHDGPSAEQAVKEHKPDLVVLDVMLPGFDGLEVCRRVRTFSDAYVVMLTARDDEVDTLVGLSVGADDYIVKPFSPRELVARVQAMLRRPRTERGPGGGAQEPLRVGELSVDTVARDVSVRGEPIELTKTEFDLLATMAARPRAAFSRRQLIESVWGANWYGDEHVVDVHVGHLRRKIGDDPTNPTFVRTVRGVGYGLGPGR